MSRARRHHSVLLASVLIGALLCASCGLTTDDRPREISDRGLTDLVTSTTSADPAPTGTEHRTWLYFLQRENLVRVAADPGPNTPKRNLGLLLNGPEQTSTTTLRTSIPPGTALRSAALNGSTLRIDLSGEIKSLGGSAAKAAYAQLVFTALDLPGVRSVRFAIEGDDIDAITDDGSLAVIRAKNFKAPLRPG